MRILTAVASALCIGGAAACAGAPTPPHPLVGSWERLALVDTGGIPYSDVPTSLLIFSPDGFYSVTTMLRQRPKVAKPVAELSREELVARFESVVARRGKYVIAGDTVTRLIEAHSDPNLEGGGVAELYTIVGDTLVLQGERGRVARYLRAR